MTIKTTIFLAALSLTVLGQEKIHLPRNKHANNKKKACCVK